MPRNLFAGRPLVEVRFGGTGGQGVIIMGVILAVAATRDHRYVEQTQSYGPEARGGYSRADVIISDKPVDYPLLLGIDVLVALSSDAAAQYVGLLGPDALFVYDSQGVPSPPDFHGRSFGIPFAKLAVESTGDARMANVLTLGAVVGISGVVNPGSLEKAVLSIVPQEARESNLEALRRGLEIAEQTAGDGSRVEESHAGSGH